MNKRYLIIGGVAAGATAAARLRRQDEDAEITILEKGPYVSFANCGLPYFISGDIKRRSKLLLQTPEGFWSRYRVKVLLNTEAVEIDRAGKRVLARGPGGEEWFAYDKLLLAQGGTPILPNVSGLDRAGVFTLWTIPDMDRIEAFLKEKQPKTAVVAGGGFVGLEMIEALRARGLDVSLVELAPQPLITMDVEFGRRITEILEEEGVQVYLEKALTSIEADSVTLSDGQRVPADLVILSVGVKPRLELARAAGLEIGPGGGLKVNELLQTSDPDIWAAGDMVEISNRVSGRWGRIPLAGPANRQGRIAAMNMAGAHVPYPGGLGTAVVKVFEYTAAATGLSEKAARALGLETGISIVVKDHHVSYYPDAQPVFLKLVYEKSSGRLLGAQAIGKAGVEKRIDAAAVALAAGMTLEQLAAVDFAYAPPYGSGNDPLNMAAYVGLNHLSGYSPLVSAAEAIQHKSQGALILDVRTLIETSEGHWKGSVLIPGDELRDRHSEIDRESEIVVVSKDGFQGHLVSRFLRQKGFEGCRFVAGGWEALRLVLPESEIERD